MQSRSLARRAEIVKMSRILGRSQESLSYLAVLDVHELRTLRDAMSARLYDDARPMLQRVATGSKLLPNALTAKVGEAVFGSTLCAQIAGLLSTPHALDLAIRMSNGFLAQVSASIDPRRAGAVIAQIPTDRVVAVAHIMLERADYVTLARFVDFLSAETIAAVIASITDELQLLRIGAYVESPAKLGELIGDLPPERTKSMIAALRGADGVHWIEALAIAEQLDDTWRKTLGDLAATLDPSVLCALAEAAHRFGAWPAALQLVLAMSETSQRTFVKISTLADPAILDAIIVAADALDRWPEVLALIMRMPDSIHLALAVVLDRQPVARLSRLVDAATTMPAAWPRFQHVVQRASATTKAEVIALASRHPALAVYSA